MKVQLKQGYILIIAPKLVAFAGRMNAGKNGRVPRAMALFPFIFVRDEEQIVPWIINHERIHFRQQLDLLFVGTWILWFIERVYGVFVLQKSLSETYLWVSAEQEAYRNQQNFDYLKNRKRFAQLWYLTHKKEFTFGQPGQIIYEDKG